MSLLSRGFSPAGSVDPSSFQPLFRFLSDFDQFNQASASSSTHDPSHHYNHILPTFRPKFDVKETANEYELHGELPGIEQKDVDIEFTDGQTLVIHGRTEQRYTKRSATSQDNKSIKSSADQGQLDNNSHQPTIEDEDDEGTRAQSATQSSTVAAKQSKEDSLQHQQQPQGRYLVSERTIGEFSRTFNFPTNVDSDAVTASMKNGILSVVVPKVKRTGGRKIQITS